MQGVPFVCAMGHVAKENECLREGKSTWVCTSTWACGYLRFFMSSSPVFKAQAVSPGGGWDGAFPGTWARVAALQSRSVGVCMCTQVFCWGKLREKPQGRAAGDLGKKKKN